MQMFIRYLRTAVVAAVCHGVIAAADGDGPFEYVPIYTPAYTPIKHQPVGIPTKERVDAFQAALPISLRVIDGCFGPKNSDYPGNPNKVKLLQAFSLPGNEWAAFQVGQRAHQSKISPIG